MRLDAAVTSDALDLRRQYSRGRCIRARVLDRSHRRSIRRRPTLRQATCRKKWPAPEHLGSPPHSAKARQRASLPSRPAQWRWPPAAPKRRVPARPAPPTRPFSAARRRSTRRSKSKRRAVPSVNNTSENQSIALSAARRNVETLKAPSTTRPRYCGDQFAIARRRPDEQRKRCALTVISNGSSTCGRRQKAAPRIQRPEREWPQRPRVPPDVAHQPHQARSVWARRTRARSMPTRHRSRAPLAALRVLLRAAI